MVEPGSPTRTIDRWILILLATGALLCWLWPGFRFVQARALWHLSVFGGRAIDRQAPPLRVFLNASKPEGDARLARLAHHLEDLFGGGPLDPAQAQTLLTTHADVTGKAAILALLASVQLNHFPSGDAKSPEVVKAVTLLDWVCARGLEVDPGNGFFVYCQAAKHHLLKKPDEALKALQIAHGMAGFNSYLLDVNRSEAELTRAQGEIPGNGQWHALDGRHPFSSMSRWLYDLTRTAVRKYNQERALEYALLHLGLGEKQWWDASTVRQASAAEQTCLRAMGSMSKGTTGGGDWAPMQAEFLGFLDDVGERQKMGDYRDTFDRLRKKGVGPWLEKTRIAQAELQPAAMTLIVFLDGVLILALAGWLALRWGSLDKQPFEPEAGLWGFVVAVAPGALYWTVWPGGLSGTYLFLTLVVSSVAWVTVLTTIAKTSKFEWIQILRSGFRGVLLGLLVVWLGTGIEHAVATEEANEWLSRVGTTPWVDQNL